MAYYNTGPMHLYTEDNDTVTAELSTSDIFSEEMEDLASESSGSHCDDISIVQSSDGSASGSEVRLLR